MAVEKKRGCGFRKVHGLYLVSDGIGVTCDRLPFELTVCPCCGAGVRSARGFTWIDVAKFFNGSHADNGACKESVFQECPLCDAPESMGKAGLLWVGAKFYPTPDKFVAEGVEMGFSRRIPRIPHGFKVGETWVLLAHKKAIQKTITATNAEPSVEYAPGIFFAWKPQRIERIRLESERGSGDVAADEKRGITTVYVPDEDADHTKGNVHEDFERDQREARESEEEQ